MSGEIKAIFVDLKTGLRKFRDEFKVEALDRIQRRTPVRSGALQKGWGATNKQNGFEIWNTEDYAGYVEFGTPFQAPKAMVRTTLEEAEQIAEIAARNAGLDK